MDRKVKIVWSDAAKEDLKNIYQQLKDYTESSQTAIRVVREIVGHSKSIVHTEQYQVDEYLGEPFRRMVVRNYKIIYKVQSKEEIRLLQIFDTRQHPSKLRK